RQPAQGRRDEPHRLRLRGLGRGVPATRRQAAPLCLHGLRAEDGQARAAAGCDGRGGGLHDEHEQDRIGELHGEVRNPRREEVARRAHCSYATVTPMVRGRRYSAWLTDWIEGCWMMRWLLVRFLTNSDSSQRFQVTPALASAVTYDGRR